MKRGVNDLATEYPDIAVFWDEEKNGDLTPSDVKSNSYRTVFWKCRKGHSSSRPVREAVLRNNPCPFCSHKKLLKGFNDFATLHPELIFEWDAENNGILTPSDILEGSGKEIAWVCPKGHHYTMPAWRRIGRDGRGCPICAGKIVIPETSLARIRPDTAALWDYEKNGSLTPSDISPKSSVKRFWKGKECGHSFSRSPKMMAVSSQCPFCVHSNTKLLKGFNDLASRFPDIAAEWDEERNGSLSPADVLSASALSVFWKCEEGHSWSAPICNRTLLHSGCPDCWKDSQSSQMECDFFDFVSSILPKNVSILKNNRTLITPKELDIYIPSLGIAFEFNGLYWHSEQAGKGRTYHYDKWKACGDKGVQLITIWEDDWRDRRAIVQSLVAHKLGVARERRVFARKTVLKDVGRDAARDFLEQHHLQGFKPGCSHIGLFLKDDSQELVALVSYRVSKGDLVIERFALDGTVVGGFSKLLKELVKIARQRRCSRIFTYSSHDISDGGNNVYAKNGFSFIEETRSLDYWYIRKIPGRAIRENRSRYQKSRFRDDDSLLYEKDAPEKRLADINGLTRIYGTGNDKFELKIR